MDKTVLTWTTNRIKVGALADFFYDQQNIDKFTIKQLQPNRLVWKFYATKSSLRGYFINLPYLLSKQTVFNYQQKIYLLPPQKSFEQTKLGLVLGSSADVFTISASDFKTRNLPLELNSHPPEISRYFASRLAQTKSGYTYLLDLNLLATELKQAIEKQKQQT